jgi:hypothetical protein
MWRVWDLLLLYYRNKELRLGVVGEGDLVNHTITQMAPTSAETKFVQESLIHKKNNTIAPVTQFAKTAPKRPNYPPPFGSAHRLSPFKRASYGAKGGHFGSIRRVHICRAFCPSPQVPPT